MVPSELEEKALFRAVFSEIATTVQDSVPFSQQCDHYEWVREITTMKGEVVNFGGIQWSQSSHYVHGF